MRYSQLTKGGKKRRIRAIKEKLFNILIILFFIIMIGLTGASDYASGIR